MKRKKVWLMCGIPASGKSTWIKDNITPTGKVISRDVVRFNMVKENEEYFSREDAVFKEFVRQINNAIDDESVTDIYVDATHINECSRNKVLYKLHLNNASIIPVNFMTSTKTCIERNSKREGRARVPDKVIYTMNKRFYPSRKDEAFKYDDIIYVKEEGA